MPDDVSTTLHIDVGRRDDATIVSVRGDLDLRSTPSLVSSVRAALATLTRGETLIIDVAGVGFCDSSGLTGFVQIRQQCTEAGLDLRLDHVPVSLLRLLELTGLREYLNVSDDTP